MKWKYIVLLLILVGCKTGGNITRTLQLVDLTANENQAYQQYPNELPFFVLKAVLNEEIPAVHIHYQEDYSIAPISVDSLLWILSETFYEDDLDLEIASSYLPLASLVGFDNLESDGSYLNTNYLTFYFPAEVTPEGLNRAFCSVAFQDAIDVLDDQNPSPVWFQYSQADWGWVYNQVFQPNYLSSTVLAKALLQQQLRDTAFLALSIDASLLDTYLSDNQIFATTFSSDQPGEIYFQDDSKSTLLATYDLQHLEALQKSANDSSWILPMALALEQRQFVVMEERIISENGTFVDSKKPDPLVKSKAKKLKPGKYPFKSNQQFFYRTTGRIVHENKPSFTENIVDALRRGELPVYENDSLKNRMQSGEFFDRLIVEDLEQRKVFGPKFIETAMVVNEVRFDMNGTSHHELKGFGLILPGKYVPEGFDRTLGYFRAEDVAKIAEVHDRYPHLPLAASHIKAVNK